MAAMSSETGFELAFAAAIVVALVTAVAAALDRAPRRAVVAVACVLGALAAAAWVAFAFDPIRELATSAGGLTAATAVALAALWIARLTEHARAVDREIAVAEERFDALISRAADERAAELERTLARARADSVSLLTEQERRIAEQRRALLAEHEERATASMKEVMAAVERRVEQRIAEWTSDLDRAQGGFEKRLHALAQRQQQLLSEAEGRVRADVERLASASEQQRELVDRLRTDIDRIARETVQRAAGELEAYETERRRALYDVSDRLRQRERELRERIEREEADAVARIQARFADAERRQLEQFGRVVERAAARLVEAAEQQFAVAVKPAREDAARRLARELERAVETFARQAQTVLAERLAHVADAGAERVEKRVRQIAAGLERERDEAIARLDRRLADTEVELRGRVQAIAADADAERAVLEARLHELSRRAASAPATDTETDEISLSTEPTANFPGEGSSRERRTTPA